MAAGRSLRLTFQSSAAASSCARATSSSATPTAARVIPREIEADVVAAARLKLNGENKSLDALMNGRLLADVYDEFGVL